MVSNLSNFGFYTLKALILLADKLAAMDDAEKAEASILMKKSPFSLLELYYDSKYESMTIFVALLVRRIKEIIEGAEAMQNIEDLRVEMVYSTQ